MKNIKVNSLVYEMLLALSKKSRSKPDAYIDVVIKKLYKEQFK